MKDGSSLMLLDKLQYLLLSLYVVLMYILGGSDDFRLSFVPLFLFIVIECVVIIKTRTIAVSKYILALFLFIEICLLTCLWAQDKNLAMMRVFTLVLLVISLVFMYNYCKRTNRTIDDILKILLLSGIALVFYMICYYGVGNLIGMFGDGSIRVGREINNVNVIGMELSTTAIISIYFGMNNDKRYYLLAIFPIVLALSTASKKAVIGIVLGVILLIIFKNRKKISPFDLMKKIALPIVILLVMLFVVQANIFPTLTRRLDSYSNNFTGNEKTDSSTVERNLFIEHGIASFLEHPIGGIGVANAGQITKEVIGRNTYLHNNYVELLATTGILGTFAYYYIFISILVVTLKNRKMKDATIIITLLVSCLVLDWGVVSYFNKITYIYILLGMMFCSNVTKGIKMDNSREVKSCNE